MPHTSSHGGKFPRMVTITEKIKDRKGGVITLTPEIHCALSGLSVTTFGRCDTKEEAYSLCVFAFEFVRTLRDAGKGTEANQLLVCVDNDRSAVLLLRSGEYM